MAEILECIPKLNILIYLYIFMKNQPQIEITG